MGTWDDGLYDNDSALDWLGDIFAELPLEKSAAHFVVGLGLYAWMKSSSIGAHPDRFQELLDKHRAWIDAAPAAARERLLTMSQDLEAFVGRDGSRPDEITAIIGGYCDGPREDALFNVPGARDVLEEFAEQCRVRLDEMVPDDLYEIAGPLAPLGVLLDLTVLGIVTAPERVATWRRTFERANEVTTDEREFFDGYVARVRAGFDLLSNAGQRSDD